MQCGRSDSVSPASSGPPEGQAPGSLCLWGKRPWLPAILTPSWSQPRVAPEGGCWGLGGARRPHQTFSDVHDFAVSFHLFLEVGFCSIQHLCFSMHSETFNKYLASRFKMFCVPFSFPYGKRQGYFHLDSLGAHASGGSMGVLDPHPQTAPSPGSWLKTGAQS